MVSIYISAITQVKGELRSVTALRGETGADLAPLAAEIKDYAVSNLDIWQLGVAAAERSLAATDVSPSLLVYVSENDPDVTGSLARIADQLNLPTVHHTAVAGHDCGNLGPSLQIAADALHCGRCDHVLLILADRALARRRVMASGMSVFSDGAAACIISRDVPGGTGPRFAVHGIATRTRVQLDGARKTDMMILSTAQLAKESAADILRATGREKAAYRYVIFPNYRAASQKFLTAAMSFAPQQLLLGPIGTGHCFSADTLATLDQYRAMGTLRTGDHLLASVTGPYSWSTMAIECL